jgi:hypothetical protein
MAIHLRVVMPLTTKLRIPSLDPFEFSLSLLIDGYRCVRYVIKSTAITN